MKQPVKREHAILIDGKPATDNEYKQIVNAPKPPAQKEDVATKHIETVARGFRLMR